MKDWDQIFKKRGKIQKKPSKDLVKTIPFLKRNKVKKILDVGCGLGRHFMILKKAGFDVYGCDISTKALKESANLLGKSKLKKCDMSNLQYKDKSFDCVISVAVLQHAKIMKIKKTIREFYRVLKKGGFVYINTLSNKDHSFNTGKEIELNTKVNTKQLDGKVPHHYFSKNELKELFSDFKIIRINQIKRKSITMQGKIRSAWVLLARK